MRPAGTFETTDLAGRRPRLLHLQRRLKRGGTLLAAAGGLLILIAASHVLTGIRAQSDALVLPPLPATAPRLPVRAGDSIGRISIPRIGLDYSVFEGLSEATLRKGPGHLPGSAYPGLENAWGNCVIAGHRDSFFRLLEEAREGDLVFLSGERGSSAYRLSRRRVVRPDETDALASSAEPRLTLITCFPFQWIGPAPYRLIWEAIPAGEASASIR
jgi:sortase A